MPFHWFGQLVKLVSHWVDLLGKFFNWVDSVRPVCLPISDINDLCALCGTEILTMQRRQFEDSRYGVPYQGPRSIGNGEAHFEELRRQFQEELDRIESTRQAERIAHERRMALIKQDEIRRKRCVEQDRMASEARWLRYPLGFLPRRPQAKRPRCLADFRPPPPPPSEEVPVCEFVNGAPFIPVSIMPVPEPEPVQEKVSVVPRQADTTLSVVEHWPVNTLDWVVTHPMPDDNGMPSSLSNCQPSLVSQVSGQLQLPDLDDRNELLEDPVTELPQLSEQGQGQTNRPCKMRRQLQGSVNLSVQTSTQPEHGPAQQSEMMEGLIVNPPSEEQSSDRLQQGGHGPTITTQAVPEYGPAQQDMEMGGLIVNPPSEEQSLGSLQQGGNDPDINMPEPGPTQQGVPMGNLPVNQPSEEQSLGSSQQGGGFNFSMPGLLQLPVMPAPAVVLEPVDPVLRHFAQWNALVTMYVAKGMSQEQAGDKADEVLKKS